MSKKNSKQDNNQKKEKNMIAGIFGVAIIASLGIIIYATSQANNENQPTIGNSNDLVVEESGEKSSIIAPTEQPNQNGNDGNGTLDITIDTEQPFFSTNAVYDESTFIHSNDKDFQGGTFKIIHNETELKEFMDETGFDFHKEELYKYRRISENKYSRYSIIAYVDSYEEDAFNRSAIAIKLEDGKLRLFFDKDTSNMLGSGYWLYFVYVDNMATDNVDLNDYPLTIEMVEKQE